MAKYKLFIQVKNKSFLDRLIIALTGFFVLLAILTGMVADRIYQAETSQLAAGGMAHNNLAATNLIAGTPTPTPFQPESTDVIETGNDQSNPDPIKAEIVQTPVPVPTPKLKIIGGGSRINILVMGLDFRNYLAGDIPRSDSMILITVDPIAKTAGMLSIPRDMWVNVPGFGFYKINTAYFLGEVNGLPGGGPALAVQTVEQFLGVPINYYAVVDFTAFTSFIDKIGGITLDIPEDIKVTPIGPGHSIVLKAGTQHLFGAEALAYARNRYTALGDFDRANRQQQVILAVRNRVLKPNIWPTLILNAPSIYQDLANGIRTNLNFNQLFQLALTARLIPANQIKHAVIGPEMVTFSTSDNGEAILIPNLDAINLLRNQIFNNYPPTDQ